MGAHELIRWVTLPWAVGVVRRHIGSITGLEHLPKRGAFVLAPNHTSYLDHFVAITLMELTRGVPLWTLTKQESFKNAPRRAWTLAWYGIPVDRAKPTPATMRAVQRVLQTPDAALGVYPEGTRGPGDQILPFKPGAFRFAVSARVPVVPMAIVGTRDVLPPGSLRFRPGRIDVAIGAPILPDPSMPKSAQTEYLAREWRVSMESLIDIGRARCTEPTDVADGRRLAAWIDDAIVEHLTLEGDLPKSWRSRYSRLVRVADKAYGPSPSIDAQSVRLVAIAASSASPIVQVLKAPGVRRGAERVLRADSDEAIANYVLGRWHLAVPRLLGARPEAALEYFRRADKNLPTDDTRGIFGAAEALERLGRVQEARESFELALKRLPDSHPRAEGRRARLVERLGRADA